jgi:Holliday junction DNA helicase RuvB
MRPARLGDFTGQPKITHDLSIMIGAAKKRGSVCDHILLYGPPGLGKTTLAGIVANELGLPLVTLSAPGIEKTGDIVSVLSGITSPTVVFIDEIHALPTASEEMLYSAMEDGALDFVVGEGRNARSIRIKLAPFVLVGATTQAGSLSAPLRDRFGFMGRLDLYAEDDLARIVSRSANLLGMQLTDDAALVIAGRSTGTPRVANRWLRRVRDWAEMHDQDTVTAEVAVTALDGYGLDPLGLDPLGREILRSIIQNFAGGPVGASTLASSVGESVRTLEEMYEPNLMRQGLIARTPRGRVATVEAYRHLGLTAPGQDDTAAPTLFPEA